MSDWGYVILAWAVTFGLLGIYAAITFARGRSLSRQVPPEDRRWM